MTEQVITPEPVDEVAELSVESTAGPAEGRRWLPDLFGLAWVIVAAVVVMAPALAHGWSLGPFDQLNRLGLSQHFIHAVKEPAPHFQTSDLIREMIPWTALAWTQVHSGILPLWNPYSGLGAHWHSTGSRPR